MNNIKVIAPYLVKAEKCFFSLLLCYVTWKPRTKCNQFCLLQSSLFTLVFLFLDHVQKTKLLKTFKNERVGEKNGKISCMQGID